jgi:hypothetical protein
MHSLTGIRTHDSSVRVGEDISCLRPRGHYDQLINILHTQNSVTREPSYFMILKHSSAYQTITNPARRNLLLTGPHYFSIPMNHAPAVFTSHVTTRTHVTLRQHFSPCSRTRTRSIISVSRTNFCFLQYHSFSVHSKIVVNTLLQKFHVMLHLVITYAPASHLRCITLASNISICIPKFNLIINSQEINTHCF